MTATFATLERWFDAGLQTHLGGYMVVGRDTYDNTNFPCYVGTTDEAHGKVNDLRKTGNRVDEVYYLNPAHKSYQFGLRRAFIYSPADIPTEMRAGV